MTATRNAVYRYSVFATDPDGDPFSYRLDEAPDGMTIDSLGRIVWETNGINDDTAEVSLAVQDDHGQSATQTYTLR